MKKPKKILIMGLPGSGKTTLASKLVPLIKAKWLNADQIRSEANDWDFSIEGRKRQADRMNKFANKFLEDGFNVVADFVCPTEKTRKDFNADIVRWVDTIKKGRFEDTNKMFEEPKKFHYRVTEQNAEKWSLQIIEDMKNKGFI